VTDSSSEREAARVHWLIAGRFSPEPKGTRFQITSQELADRLVKNLSAVRVSAPDRLGNRDTRDFELSVGSLKSLTLGGVVQAIPELKDLLALSSRGSLPERDALLAEVDRIVGQGRLLQACAAACDDMPSGPTAPPPSPAATPAAPPPGADVVDAIFEKATPSEAPSASRAVSAFVSATSTSKTTAAAKPSIAKKVRTVLEGAIYGTAHQILRSEPLSQLESNWRGLKLLLEQCPPSAGIHVEILDVAADGLVAALRDIPREDSLDDPDVVFVTEPDLSPILLAELADLSEETLTPCVAGVSPGFFGAADLDQLLPTLEALSPEKKEPWDALRKSDASRWLCLVSNRILLFTEGAGETRHLSFASPVWAIAAMLAASFKAQGSFARLVGKPGALRGGGTWIISEGRHKDTATPTERFFPIASQTELAVRGIVGLGSPKNSDQIMLTLVPMLSAALDAAPLPGQILTGRIVRFARWVRRQIGAEAGPKEVSDLFNQAASIFLFPGMSNVAALAATMVEQDGKRSLKVAAHVKASHALLPFQIEFSLPL
jgi:type VI secretion system protein ImpC